MAAPRKPRVAKPRSAASAAGGDTLTISREDLASIVADQVAKANASTTQPLTRQLDEVLESLRARPPVQPAADVDAGPPTRTRGTLVTAASSQAAAVQQAAFTAFNYRAFLQLAKPFAQMIKSNCEQFNYPPMDAFIQICQESGFNPLAKSSSGALGLCQIMPDRAKEWGIDPLDPNASIRALVVHMHEYREEYSTDSRPGGANRFHLPNAGEAHSFATLELALAAWDAGQDAVNVANGIPNFATTQGYVAMVGGTVRAILSNAPMRARWIEDWNALLR